MIGGRGATTIFAKYMKELPWQIVVFALLVAMGLSGISVTAASICEGQGWFSFSTTEFAGRFLLGIVLYGVVLLGLLFFADRFGNQENDISRRSLFWKVCIPKWSVACICVSAAVMLVAWIPWLLAFYPASMNWDTYYQIAMYSGETPVWVIPYAPTGSIVDHAFSDHHPFFDTLIYGIFAQSGRVITGSWNSGVFLFVLIQSAGMAVSFAASVSFFAKKGCPKTLLAGVYIFFLIAPFVPAYAGTMVKDTLFSWLYVPYFLLVFEICCTRGKAVADRKLALIFIILGLLLCLTKKTGPYIVIPTAIILLLIYKKSITCFVFQIGLSALLMWFVLPQLVFPAFDVIPGGKQEAYAVLFQQTARCAVDYPDDITQEEKDAIDAVIGYDGLAERYTYDNADSVKFWYRYDTVTDEDMKRYLRVWFEQGLRHPDSYFESWLAATSRYFAEEGTIGLLEDTSDVDHDGSSLLSRPEAFNPLRQALLNTYHAMQKIPLLDILLSVSLYAFVIPVGVLYVMICRRRDLLPSFVPVALCMASCAITPCFDTRYALPLIYTAPLLICAITTSFPRSRVHCPSSERDLKSCEL